MSQIEKQFDEICTYLKKDELCVRFSKIGFCRNWTGAALAALDKIKTKNKFIVDYEARETEVSPCYFHTFVLIILSDGDNELNYLMDGAGVAGLGTYFGPESSAPTHLSNSQLDQISRYRKLIEENKKKS
ncbi:hypothetical protein C4564_02555 [Candidatus Microgenomates bacterium]|nr:MAG: hypothetical protein C4564_02555 [Candidatus Microgenomates bacterium]